MAVYTQLSKAELADVVDDYGLVKLIAVSGIPNGSVNTNYRLETTRGRHLLRIDEVKGELDVKRELDLLVYLRKHGFPCPQPLADRKGRLYRQSGGKCVSVYRWLDGQLGSPTASTRLRLENDRPRARRSAPDRQELQEGHREPLHLRARRPALRRGARAAAALLPQDRPHARRRGRATSSSYLENKLPKGVIHGDLFHDNLLFKGDKLVAMLDFEAACRGKFIFDLATAVNALCFDGASYALKRFEALIAGYESLRPLSLAEWDAFPNELRLSAFRFTVTRLRDFVLRPDERRPAHRQGLPRVLRAPAHPATRARRRHGCAAHGDGHRATTTGSTSG